MNWYCETGAMYTHVSVYVHGEKKGSLMFTHAEFEQIKRDTMTRRSPIYSFLEEDEPQNGDPDTQGSG
jgi:hypothetical protein